MTEKILTITGLSFSREGESSLYGTVIEESGSEHSSLTEQLCGGTLLLGNLTSAPEWGDGRMVARMADGDSLYVQFFGKRFILSQKEEQKVSFWTPLRRLVCGDDK